MKQRLAMITLLVKEYEEAISFYTDKMNFQLAEDTVLDDGKRWVVVRPEGGNSSSLLLAKASNSVQYAQIGQQSGDRVFLFLHTDDFRRDYKAMRSAGIEFLEEPRTEPYGVVAVFKDLYGNRWDLLESSTDK
ncbi:MAG: VOC family protein [Flavobacteriaceae bacterium]